MSAGSFGVCLHTRGANKPDPRHVHVTSQAVAIGRAVGFRLVEAIFSLFHAPTIEYSQRSREDVSVFGRGTH